MNETMNTVVEEVPKYHVEMRRGDVGRYVLLPGDPQRVPTIASFLDDAHEVAHNREHLTFTGRLDGVAVSVTSTGIGGPSTAIAVEELAQIGADTFIRVGTSGLMQPDEMESGDLVVVSGAVRDEGTASHYMPLAFPALADLDVVDCLRQACREGGVAHHVGLTHSKDSFYGEVEAKRMPLADDLQRRPGHDIRIRRNLRRRDVRIFVAGGAGFRNRAESSRRTRCGHDGSPRRPDRR